MSISPLIPDNISYTINKYNIMYKHMNSQITLFYVYDLIMNYIIIIIIRYFYSTNFQ